MTIAWIVVNVVLGLTGLTPGTAGAPVAWQAHIFGYFAGLVLDFAIVAVGADESLKDVLNCRAFGGRLSRPILGLAAREESHARFRRSRDKGDMVFTAAPNDSVAQVAAMLHQRRVGAMVVVEGDREVVGIVSERDIVRVVAETADAGWPGRCRTA